MIEDLGSQFGSFFLALDKMKQKMMDKITDLALALYLSAISLKLHYIKRSGKKLTFIFEDSWEGTKKGKSDDE